MSTLLFSFNKYKDKIYSVSNLRLLSFEIYKLFVFYIIISIISRLSKYFPFSYFYEIDFNFYILTKIAIFLLIIDLCYYILLKSNVGQFSYPEIILSFIQKPNIIKILLISISFFAIFLFTNELKSLMPRLNSIYVKDKYNIEPIYKDDYEENYYLQKGLSKSTIYENADNTLIICACIIYIFNFIIIKQNFWTRLDINRISNLKNKLLISIRNIANIGVPLFFIIYIILIGFYHTLFVFDLCLNYTSLFIIEYNILYITKECLNNFICSKINYICYEINSIEKLIKKDVDFKNEENFYIIHHLLNLNDLYKFPHNVKINEILLKLENLNVIKKKIYYFNDLINRKYAMFLKKKNFFKINNDVSGIDNIKKMIQNFSEFFDYRAKQIFENETCVENLKIIINIIGNIILFISDAKINKSNEEKYMEYSDNIYFFIERLFDIDKILFNFIKKSKNNESFWNELTKIRRSIKYYFYLIRNRQNKCGFIKMETQNIQTILYSN